MGTFSVDLWVGSLFAEAGATVSALVDTGATNTMLPASLLHELGIEPVETRFAQVADGRRVELQTAWAPFPCRDAMQWRKWHLVRKVST